MLDGRLAHQMRRVEHYLVGDNTAYRNYGSMVLVRAALAFLACTACGCAVIICLKGFALEPLLPTLLVVFLLVVAIILVKLTGSPVVPALLMTVGILGGATMRAQASGGIFCHNVAFFVLPPSMLLFFAGPRLALVMLTACAACLVQLWRERRTDRAVVLAMDADHVGTLTLAVLLTVIAGTFALSYLWWKGAQRALDRAEQALKEAQDANKAKSQFMAFLCHEIRNPLHAIMNMTDFLLQEESGVRGSHRSDAVSIRSSCDLMLAIVDDVLDLSRIESGGLAFEHLPFDLRRLLSDHVRAAQPSAQAKGISLAFRCALRDTDRSLSASASASRVLVMGDPTRVNQVLANLLSNALKFTNSGGAITVTLDEDAQAAPVPASASASPPAGARVFRVSVSDTGIGISAEDLPKLFQPYSQVGLSTARTHGGSGLGLSIVAQLAKMMGGQLQVRSQPAQGTTFVLLVPLHPALPADLAKLPLVDSPMQPVRGLSARIPPSSSRAPPAGLHTGHEHSQAPTGPAVPFQTVASAADVAPAVSAVPLAAPVSRSCSCSLCGGRCRCPVLLVEDDVINQKLLMRMVGGPGSGLRALAALPDAAQARAEAQTLLAPPVPNQEQPQQEHGSLETKDGGPPAERLTVHVAGHGLHALRLLLRRTLYLYLGQSRMDEAPRAIQQMDAELCALLAPLVPRQHLAALGEGEGQADDPSSEDTGSTSSSSWALSLTCPLAAPGPLLSTVAAFCPRPYPLVLMDLNMPVLDGYCASRVLRHLGFTMPIVAVSANALIEERQKAQHAGITDFLAKPFRKQNFLQLIEQTLPRS